MRSSVFALLLALGCAAPPAPTPPPAAALRAAPERGPLGDCGDNLSGLWRDSEDGGFRYLARDDGGVLVLEAVRTRSDGGSQSSEVVLVRSTDSFIGAVGVAHFHGDAGCAALFPAEVVSCADGGLWVATVDRLRVDARCQPLAQKPSPSSLHRLVRVALDAGP